MRKALNVLNVLAALTVPAVLSLLAEFAQDV